MDEHDVQRLRDTHWLVTARDDQGEYLLCRCGDEACDVVDLLAAYLQAQEEIKAARDIMGWYIIMGDAFRPINTERTSLEFYQLVRNLGEKMMAYAERFGKPEPGALS